MCLTRPIRHRHPVLDDNRPALPTSCRAREEETLSVSRDVVAWFGRQTVGPRRIEIEERDRRSNGEGRPRCDRYRHQLRRFRGCWAIAHYVEQLPPLRRAPRLPPIPRSLPPCPCLRQ